MDTQKLAADMVRSWRGDMGQLELSEALGFRSNVVHHWESQRSGCQFTSALRMLERAHPGGVRRLCIALQSDWTERVDPLDRVGTALILNDVFAGVDVSLVVRRTEFSRHKIGRWLRGDSEPTLDELLEVLLAVRMIWMLFPLLAPDLRLPTAPPDTLGLKQQEALFALISPKYQELPAHDAAWVAARVGHSLDEIEEHIAHMRSLGLVRWDGTHWLVQLDQVRYNRRGVPNLEAHLGQRIATRPSRYTDGTLLIATREEQDQIRRIFRQAKREIFELVSDTPPVGEVLWATMALTLLETSPDDESA